MLLKNGPSYFRLGLAVVVGCVGSLVAPLHPPPSPPPLKPRQQNSPYLPTLLEASLFVQSAKLISGKFFIVSNLE